MAGPGGGPPRKSHTKSRKGCKTCKRRHIRCDETFPQCRNCTKHNCRCDYMDSSAANEDRPRSPRDPDLLVTPEIQQELEAWHATGVPTFPELQLTSPTYWKEFKMRDLRLVHHIAGLSIDMHRRGFSSCAIWAQKMPTFLTIAMSTDFVMSAVMALSAAHLAWRNENPETESLFYYHRGIALKGLHEAIGSFSRENSDAILAASMLLSWLATEWRHWASLQQGISSVLNSMQPWWKEESELASYLEEQRSLRHARTPVTPNFPPNSNDPANENITRIDQVGAALRNTHQRVSQSSVYSTRILELGKYLHNLRADLPLQSPEEAFERMQEFRSWLFWLPPTLLRDGGPDPIALAILSQFYGVALALEPLFPEIGGAYLGSVVTSPLEVAHQILVSRKSTNPYAADVQFALELIEWPMRLLSEYKSRGPMSASPLEMYRSLSQGPYGVSAVQLATPPDLNQFSNYTTSAMPSPSALGIPSSPYHQASTEEISSRRHSPYLHPSTSIHPSIASTEPNYNYSLESPSFSSGYVQDSGVGRLGYYEVPNMHYSEGFVAPSPLWT